MMPNTKRFFLRGNYLKPVGTLLSKNYFWILKAKRITENQLLYIISA